MTRKKSASGAGNVGKRSQRHTRDDLPESRDEGAREGRAALGTGPTTRKTIEVPEDYFYMVKQRALHRRIKEKQLWSEILLEYFTTHPNA